MTHGGSLMPEHPRHTSAPPFDTSRRYVRIRGERKGLIEFDFAIGEPELFVELLLSPAALADFCAIHAVEALDAEAEDVSRVPLQQPAGAVLLRQR
jgi:hypothetical protein